MTGSEAKGPKASNSALARWDNEGGARRPLPEKDRDKRTALVEDEERILRGLGAAVITRWNDLSIDVQRELFRHAVSIGERHNTVELKEQIARFLHDHKNDERESN
jgi:hypothetical protein